MIHHEGNHQEFNMMIGNTVITTTQGELHHHLKEDSSMMTHWRATKGLIMIIIMSIQGGPNHYGETSLMIIQGNTNHLGITGMIIRSDILIKRTTTMSTRGIEGVHLTKATILNLTLLVTMMRMKTTFYKKEPLILHHMTPTHPKPIFHNLTLKTHLYPKRNPLLSTCMNIGWNPNQ